jgi:hypothetical protein
MPGDFPVSPGGDTERLAARWTHYAYQTRSACRCRREPITPNVWLAGGHAVAIAEMNVSG